MKNNRAFSGIIAFSVIIMIIAFQAGTALAGQLPKEMADDLRNIVPKMHAHAKLIRAVMFADLNADPLASSRKETIFMAKIYCPSARFVAIQLQKESLKSYFASLSALTKALLSLSFDKVRSTAETAMKECASNPILNAINPTEMKKISDSLDQFSTAIDSFAEMLRVDGTMTPDGKTLDTVDQALSKAELEKMKTLILKED